MADISSDKIRQLLSDPKNIELIAGIAGSMGGNGGLLGALSGSDQKENDTGKESMDGVSNNDFTDNAQNEIQTSSFPDLSQSFAPAVNNISSDKRIALLKAIKPYISDSKKERVDGLVKAISVAGILSNYKGGLFG